MATERRMGGVSLKYLSSLSLRNKGEKKRKKERKKENKTKQKKQQSPGDQMRLGLGGLVHGVFILPYTKLFLSI